MGRLSRDKGVDVLIEAFRQIAEKVPNARMIILGAGPQQATLKEQARRIGNRVEFLGQLAKDEKSNA